MNTPAVFPGSMIGAKTSMAITGSELSQERNAFSHLEDVLWNRNGRQYNIMNPMVFPTLDQCFMVLYSD